MWMTANDCRSEKDDFLKYFIALFALSLFSKLYHLFRTPLFESTKYLLNNTKFKFFTHVKRMNNKTTSVIPTSVMQISGDNSKYRKIPKISPSIYKPLQI